MNIPVEEIENLKLLLKQCYLFDTLERLEQIENRYTFYGRIFLVLDVRMNYDTKNVTDG